MSDKDEAIAPVGGQAVIEGVMMRSRGGYAVALLKGTQRPAVKWFPYPSLSQRKPLFARPFFRGMGALFESLAIGMKSLLYSAAEQEIAEQDSKKRAELEKEREKARRQMEKTDASPLAMGVMVAFSVVFALLFFVVLPNVLLELLGIKETAQPLLFNAVSGLLRIVLFVAYIALISLMPDIRRVFQFHGAEHKAVNAYEAGKPNRLAVVRTFTTLHPRCGTSFLFFVLVVAILVFAFVPFLYTQAWPWFTQQGAVLQKTLIILTHILLLPVVSGIAYELIRFSWRKRSLLLCRVLMAPGLTLQRITTREPDDTQLKVAIAALREALKHHQGQAPSSATDTGSNKNTRPSATARKGTAKRGQPKAARTRTSGKKSTKKRVLATPR